jgi:large subunit ribosomal protein L27
MAHKKAGGSSRNGRDSEAKRLGVKLFGGQKAVPGNVILRQRGTQWHPGENVGIGRDHTLFATAEGRVTFKRGWKDRQFVSIVPDAPKALAAE